MELTGTHLRYLLHMYEMSKRENEMRLTEIANALHVKKASVARIVNVFREKELVDQEHYGKVHMTAHGKQVAAMYYSRVSGVAECLMQAGLLLTRQQALDAACILLPELPETCVDEKMAQKMVAAG